MKVDENGGESHHELVMSWNKETGTQIGRSRGCSSLLRSTMVDVATFDEEDGVLEGECSIAAAFDEH